MAISRHVFTFVAFFSALARCAPFWPHHGWGHGGGPGFPSNWTGSFNTTGGESSRPGAETSSAFTVPVATTSVSVAISAPSAAPLATSEPTSAPPAAIPQSFGSAQSTTPAVNSTAAASSAPEAASAPPVAMSSATSADTVPAPATSAAPAPAAVTSAASPQGSASGSIIGSATADCEGQGDACEGDVTHWDGGLGACGNVVDTTSEYAIALPVAFMGALSNTNPYCGRSVTLYNPTNGNTVSATVQDKCDGCADRAIDCTDILFTAITGGDLGLGREHNIVWWLN